MEFFQAQNYLTYGQNNLSWEYETNFYALKMLHFFFLHLGDSNPFLKKKTKSFNPYL